MNERRCDIYFVMNWSDHVYLRVSYPVQYKYQWYILPDFWFVPAISYRSACPHNSQTIQFDDDAVTLSSLFVFIRHNDFPPGCSDQCFVLFVTSPVTRCYRWCLISCARRIHWRQVTSPLRWLTGNDPVLDSMVIPCSTPATVCLALGTCLIYIVSSSFYSEWTLGLRREDRVGQPIDTSDLTQWTWTLCVLLCIAV